MSKTPVVATTDRGVRDHLCIQICGREHFTWVVANTYVFDWTDCFPKRSLIVKDTFIELQYPIRTHPTISTSWYPFLDYCLPIYNLESLPFTEKVILSCI